MNSWVLQAPRRVFQTNASAFKGISLMNCRASSTRPDRAVNLNVYILFEQWNGYCSVMDIVVMNYYYLYSNDGLC